MQVACEKTYELKPLILVALLKKAGMEIPDNVFGIRLNVWCQGQEEEKLQLHLSFNKEEELPEGIIPGPIQ